MDKIGDFHVILIHDMYIYRTLRSSTETFTIGIRNASPDILSFTSGMILPRALHAPVEAGIIF